MDNMIETQKIFKKAVVVTVIFNILTPEWWKKGIKIIRKLIERSRGHS